MPYEPDPHIQPADFRCCGKCKTEHKYNGTDYDTLCTCERDCNLPKHIKAMLTPEYQIYVRRR